MEFDPCDPNNREDFERLDKIDAEFLKKFLAQNFEIPKISWWTHVLFWFSPIRGAVRLAKELGLPDGELSAKAHALFIDARRVDIVPSRSGMRGFRIVLNNMLSIFFSQDGDHFVYDGFEMGPHEGGEVTIFDSCNKPRGIMRIIEYGYKTLFQKAFYDGPYNDNAAL